MWKRKMFLSIKFIYFRFYFHFISHIKFDEYDTKGTHVAKACTFISHSYVFYYPLFRENTIFTTEN